MSELSSTLKQMLTLAQKTEREVGDLGIICPTYVRRLIDGEKENVTPEALRRIWIGIVFDREIVRRAKKEGQLDIQQGLARLAEAAVMSAPGSRGTGV